MTEINKIKENKMKRRNDMKLGEMVFDTDHCDESGSLNLVNEFFETNDEPTTNGREYKGWRGVSDGNNDPCRVSPYSFGLKERVFYPTYWEGHNKGNGSYDYNKLLGWPTDVKENKSGWTPRGSGGNY